MRPDELLASLTKQNPWWSDRSARAAPNAPTRRAAFERILGHFGAANTSTASKRRALLLVGPRQVGKTTLMRQTVDALLDRGVPPTSVIYVDFDLPGFGPPTLAEVEAAAPPT